MFGANLSKLIARLLCTVMVGASEERAEHIKRYADNGTLPVASYSEVEGPLQALVCTRGKWSRLVTMAH